MKTLIMRQRKMWKMLPLMLMIIFALGAASAPADAAATIKETEYEGNGRVEVNFASRVKYKNLKVIVKNKAGKTQKVRILEKDNDELEFKILNYKQGQTYTFTIKGIRKKGEKKYGSVSGSVQLPTSKGNVPVRTIEYDASDQEVSFEFETKVKWKSPKVIIKRNGKNYVRYIDEKDRNELEVAVKKLQKGVTYQYSISGIGKQSDKGYTTITGSFRP